MPGTQKDFILFVTNKLRLSTYLCTPSGNPKLTLWLSLSVLEQFFLSPDSGCSEKISLHPVVIYSSQRATHFIRHAVDVKVRDKKNTSAPVIIAPTALVAANVTASSISDANTPPNIPVSSAGRTEHIHSRASHPCTIVDVIKAIARYTTEIPSTTHKKAGATVIIAENCKNAVIIPTIMLATIARPTQLLLQPHPNFDILSPPLILYEFKFG